MSAKKKAAIPKAGKIPKPQGDASASSVMEEIGTATPQADAKPNVFPVLLAIPCWHAVAHHPGEANRFCRLRFPIDDSLLPVQARSAFRIVLFGAALAFTNVTACHVADSLSLPPCSQAPTALLPLLPLG
jgi:hypothetical protein